ncbi:MAG: DEAD/DEAH box helicase family protein, partial [Actinomycetota bacterium]
TDRRILDKQIRDTINQFTHVAATVGEAKNSGDLRRFIEGGKRIVVSTIQKFPMILDEIGDQHRHRRFAIIIDEAHSSQGGKSTSAMSGALGAAFATENDESDETYEDEINRIMEARKFLTNASYFAFTATPKGKTLELFGEPVPGTLKRRPFHGYTMKQAIDEGFIIDVLGSYTPVQSYYRLVKTVEGDPEFDTKRAGKKLRRYVEENDDAIRTKAEIMADHFHEQVIGQHKIGGQARAMVVTDGVERAISYWQALSTYLAERNSPYNAIIAFSGEREVDDVWVSEARLNGFPSQDIPDRLRQDPYRFLVVADKFQTGYDEPLLHTMYADKPLSGIKAVQTLSRLNRAHPLKHDVFVLDFMNDVDTIRASFEDYYRTTVLSDETDPDKLHDLKSTLDAVGVYAQEDVDDFVEHYLAGSDRTLLDPILDACVATYIQDLGEDGQVEFKGTAKTFVRTYNFLSAILPYTKADWEKLSIFLSFLVLKLPAPAEDDLSKGILETIDMDSYRVEKRAAMRILLPDEGGLIDPVPGGEIRAPGEPELDRLSNIIKSFNDQFGGIEWNDSDRIQHLITEQIPKRVAADPAYQNARENSDKQNARIEHDKALGRVMTGMLKDDTQLFKEFSDNESFRKWLAETVFGLTYALAGSAAEQGTLDLAPGHDASERPFEVVPDRAARPGINCVPLVSLKAAAGYVGDEKLVDPEAWVTPNGRTKPAPNLFTAQVVGESMNRRIPNGAYCLFRYPVVGSRNGRVVLVEHRDIADPELEGPFTLKIWHSSKTASEDGPWRHEQILLEPDSTDPGYEPIILKDVAEGDAQVIAELVEVLGSPA